MLLEERRLHYCALPKGTDRSVAINIFVETNQSSAKIKEFDIVVARAQAQYDEDLRNKIALFGKTTPFLSHYFSSEPEEMIPQVGEWILKVACLKLRRCPPKEPRYKDTLPGLLDADRDPGVNQLNALQEDLEAALDFASQNGGSTKKTLPS